MQINKSYMCCMHGHIGEVTFQLGRKVSEDVQQRWEGPDCLNVDIKEAVMLSCPVPQADQIPKECRGRSVLLPAPVAPVERDSPIYFHCLV